MLVRTVGGHKEFADLKQDSEVIISAPALGNELYFDKLSICISSRSIERTVLNQYRNHLGYIRFSPEKRGVEISISGW